MSRQRYTAKEVRDAIREANGVVAQAARMLGCAPKTVYNYADRYSTVEEAMRDARVNLAAEAETHLVQMMRDKDNPSQRYKAIKDVLRNYHPDDWTDSKEAREVSGANGEAVKVVFEQKPTADE